MTRSSGGWIPIPGTDENGGSEDDEPVRPLDVRTYPESGLGTWRASVQEMTVGIVGAGVTGLALAHYLHRQGTDAVVFEAASEPGGVIRSRRVDGRVLDLGPQRTRLTPGVVDLVEAAGLTEAVLEAPDRSLFVYHDGRLRRVPTTIRGAVATDLLSTRGKLRSLLEPLAGPPREGETVGAFFRRAFGPEVAERVAGPLYAGLYASNSDEMPVEHSLSRALDRLGAADSILLSALRSRLAGRTPSPVVSFDGGMGTLPATLCESLGRDVRLETPVLDLRKPRGHRGGREAHGNRNGRGRYDLVTPNETVAVDRVVLTVPAGEAGALLSGVAPEAARPLDRLRYNPLAVVHLHADLDREGAGYQIPPGDGFVTRGVTWNGSLFAGRDRGDASNGREGLVTCFLGGATRPAVVEWSDDRLGTVAAAEFKEVTGRPASPIAVHRVTPGMPAYDTS